MDPLALVLEEILLRMDLRDISVEKRAEYRHTLYPIIQNRLFTAVINSLTKQEKAYLEKHKGNERKFEIALNRLLEAPEKQEIMSQEVQKLIEELSYIPQ